MTAPQIREENRKLPESPKRPPTRAELRKARRLANPYTPASQRLLAFMAEQSELMTVARAQEILDIETQSARNCICKLVRQGLLAVDTPKWRTRPATYRITHAGMNTAAARDSEIHGYVLDDPEVDLATELAERADARAKVETNLAHARVKVPNSVFALATVRAGVRAERAAA